MLTLTAPPSASNPITDADTLMSLLDQSFLFSINGNLEDYAHQLLELNGLACQLNHLLERQPAGQCVQSAIGVVIPQDMTAVQTYELGQKIGQQEYQQFVTLNPSLPEVAAANPPANPLVALADWWAKSYLAHYGQIFVDPRRTADPYFFVDVMSIQTNYLKKDTNRPDCAFYAGVMAGFFSRLVGDQFEVIEPECRRTVPHVCKFILGRSEVLNAHSFWQSIDTASIDTEFA